MGYDNIRVTRDDGIATLTIDRPEVRNALEPRHRARVSRGARHVGCRRDLGVLIITGAGDASFVAGADIGDLNRRTVAEGLAAINSSLFVEIERFPRPTIAAVNGYALGGGCELALACDIRIAADGAKFGLPELGLGIIPGAGGTQRLPRIVGLGRAKHLVLTGTIIDAAAALRIGLVSDVVPAAELTERVTVLARRILRQGPLDARLAKLALNASARVDLDSGLLIETLAQGIAFGSDDKREGTSAFLEKRKPLFTGK